MSPETWWLAWKAWLYHFVFRTLQTFHASFCRCPMDEKAANGFVDESSDLTVLKSRLQYSQW